MRDKYLEEIEKQKYTSIVQIKQMVKSVSEEESVLGTPIFARRLVNKASLVKHNSAACTI